MEAHLRGVRTTTGSVTWAPDIDRAVSKFAPDIVYHLAAQIDVRTSVENPEADATTNVMGTLNVLEACRAWGVKRFVLASSSAVYGHHAEPVDLLTPYMPISPYGASKVAAEAYAAMYGRMCTLAGVAAPDPADAIVNGLQCTTVILSNVYGPRQRADFGAVNIFARRLLAGEPVTIYGVGGNVRDYLHVSDAVRTLMWAGGCQASANPRRLLPGRVMCGTGYGTTDRELYDIVAREVAAQTGVEVVADLLDYAPARPADIRSLVFAHETQRTPLDVGVRTLVQELRKELEK
jgi:UDP-glucose 4-epimerase